MGTTSSAQGVVVSEEPSVDLRQDVPHGARIWNYWLGGKDNYEVDRAIGDAVQEYFPTMPEYARTSRQFLVRVVRYLAGEAGITQFLDVGTGLPTMQNTHEVAQGVLPSARVVYVDNDPLVLAHARALLVNTTPEGRTTYLDADYNNPQAIIDGARELLDFDRPIAVLFMGVFGYLPDPEDAHGVITKLMAPMPSGSYMALWDSTDTSEIIRKGAQAQADLGSPYALRAVEEIRGWFGGLELVEPGLVQLPQWRPALVDIDTGTPGQFDGYGAVGRKP